MLTISPRINKMREKFKNDPDFWTKEQRDYFESLSFLDKIRLVRAAEKLSRVITYKIFHEPHVMAMYDFFTCYMGLSAEKATSIVSIICSSKEVLHGRKANS